MKVKVEMIIESNSQADEDNPPADLESALKEDFNDTMNCADLFNIVGEATFTTLGE